MTQEINLDLASGAQLKLLYFSDHELRWIFNYRYIGEKDPGADPEVVNQVKLVANYADGLLATQIVLSMHIIIPGRLGQQFLAGMDISPGAKTYLEFSYERGAKNDGYRLTEISKDAREHMRLDGVGGEALVKPIAFPFPIPDRLSALGRVQVPFRLNNGHTSHFDLPTRIVR